MPIARLIEVEAFDPEAIAVITRVFEDVLVALHLVDRADPLVEIVAKSIIRFARGGERDPARLRALVLKSLQD